MTKADLIKALAERAGLSRRQAEAFLAAFEDIVKEELAKHGEFRLSGFGRLIARMQKPRKVNLFGSGKVKMTQPKPAVRFKAAKALLEAVAKYFA